jgi:glycerophosphoryl diester phosphodiesterase
VLLLLVACSPGVDPTAPSGELRVVGHRGASGLAPENTLAALERAQAVGAREVEIDVRLTRDGVPVLFHDAGLGRKTELEGLLADQDWATLEGAEIGRWFHRTHPEVPRRYVGTGIATLDEALARHGDDFVWHIELKAPDEALSRAVLGAIDRAGVRGRVEVSSFHTPQLLEMRELAPDLPLCLIVPRTRERRPEGPGAPTRLTPDQGLDRATSLGFAAVALAIHDVTQERVQRAHDRGIAVRAFRLQGDEDLEQALALGVDAVTVAHPGRTQASVARLRR